MSDAGRNDFELDEPAAPAPDEAVETEQAPQVVRRKRSMFDDPVVKAMAFGSAGLVVLFLALILGGLLTGVSAPTGPRTIQERNVAVARAEVSQGSTDTAVWGAYIAALIENGDYAIARNLIQQGRQNMPEARSAEFTLAEARLMSAQGKYEDATKLSETAMKMIREEWDRRIAAGGPDAKIATADGVHHNYYAAALVKAYAHRELGQWEEAIKGFDVYIGWKRGAADILVDRANAKLEIDDKKGAEEDFRAALRFVPDDAEALSGLEKMGVAK